MKTQKFYSRALSLAVASILAVGVGAFSVNSYAAGTDTENLLVSAEIQSSCVINSTTAVTFGVYDPIVANFAAPLNFSGEVNSTCTEGAAATVTLGIGTNGTGTAAEPVRRMVHATDTAKFLSYTLSSVSSGGAVWGNTEGTGKSTVGTGAPVALVVYGQIPANQFALPVGAYSDTVVATITF